MEGAVGIGAQHRQVAVPALAGVAQRQIIIEAFGEEMLLPDGALDLDDRDPEARRVEHEALKRLAPLRDDQEPMGGAASGEGLLDGAAARDELLLIGPEERRSLRIRAG